MFRLNILIFYNFSFRFERIQLKMEKNIWKLFLYNVSQRRHFLPILSIYFLTLPNTNAQQIGIYTGLGYLASFLFEIPSGYFSDIFGHKRTLVLSKILMIGSVLIYIFAGNFYYFIAGSIFHALASAFDSGTKEAIVHDILSDQNREKEYTKVMGKFGANVSLVSMFLIMGLPFFTSIDITLPLKINLVFDVIGLIAIVSLSSPKKEIKIEKKDQKNIMELLKISQKQKFFPIAIFSGAILGFLFADNPFRMIYLESLGYPVIFVGFVMGFSRLFWFIIGHYAHYIERYLTMKQHFLIEIFLFTGYYFLVASLLNPYIIGGVFALIVGYQWGRSQVVKGYLLKRVDQNYKATMLSVQSQIASIIMFFVAFGIGGVMESSYKNGFYVLGIALFLILVATYFFLKEDQNSIEKI